MREIEFRGQEIDSGKWLFGSLAHYKDDDSYYINYTDEYGDDIGTMVVPETVGQFTGYITKDNVKVYEGDIVEFETNVNCITSEIKPYWKDCYEKQCEIGGGTWWVRKDQAIVQWDRVNGMWALKVYNNGRYKRKSKLFTYRASGYVVVGNIFDNKELINERDTF
jgi:uncharacterized phage protein (TIGR01671 family)